jgi:hypothetical protein
VLPDAPLQADSGMDRPLLHPMPGEAHEMAICRQATPGAAWMLAPGAACLHTQIQCGAQAYAASDRPQSMPKQILA